MQMSRTVCIFSRINSTLRVFSLVDKILGVSLLFIKENEILSSSFSLFKEAQPKLRES